MLRKLIASQVRMSKWLDGILPHDLRISGSSDFSADMVGNYIRPGLVVCDVGGGSRPFFSAAEKSSLGLTVIGLDIDADELAKAPSGCYDLTTCADLTKFQASADVSADLVICRTVLEHVRDNHKAFQSLAGMLKPGGTLLVFLPTKFAWFAVANRLLPERLKQRLLFSLFPHKADGHSGFPAFYDRCSPKEFARLAEACNLEVQEQRLYYWSSYFTIFFPLHAAYQLGKFALRPLVPELVAETFAMALCKPKANMDAPPTA